MDLIHFFKILTSKACQRYRLKIFFVLKLYSKLDRHITRFQNKTGLSCQKGCGRCCENPHIEATVLEVLPLAVELWRTKKAQKIYQHLEKGNFTGRCNFYKPDPLIEGKGRCQVYFFRPLLCRLFGFSAILDKQNKPTLVSCRVIKSSQEQLFEDAERNIVTGLDVPFVNNYTMNLRGIDPDIAQKQLPINQAVALAIEKIGMGLKYK